jgi:DNA-binding beta-propeller fold protein YncE
MENHAPRRAALGCWWLAAVVAAVSLRGGGAAAAEIMVLVGAADGRSGAASARIVNEPFSIDFDREGRLYGVEFTRGNRVFRTVAPVASAGGAPAVEFVAGVFRQTDSKTPAVFEGECDAEAAQFNGVHDLAVGNDGRVYLADTFNHVIRLFDPVRGRVGTVAGSGAPGFAGDGGPAAGAAFNQPYCGALSPDGGRLLVADLRNHRLRSIDLAAETVRTIAGTGRAGRPVDGVGAADTPLSGPRAACEAADGTVYLVLREGNALVAIRGGRVRVVVNASGKAGYAGDGGFGSEALLSGPKYVCIDGQQRVLIVDTENHCIRRYDPRTEAIDLVAGVPQRPGAEVGSTWQQMQLRRPHGARIAPDGRLVVVDSDNDRLLIGPY